MTLLQNLFGVAPGRAYGSDAQTVRRIGKALERLPPERARYLACFAFVLSRVANADLDISAVETKEMERLLRERGELPDAEAALVVEIAKNQNRLFGGTENFVVTRELAKSLDADGRDAMLRCLFEVAAADQVISVEEDAELRKISAELGYSHKEFVAIRAEYGDRRAVMKGLKKK